MNITINLLIIWCDRLIKHKMKRSNCLFETLYVLPIHNHLLNEAEWQIPRVGGDELGELSCSTIFIYHPLLLLIPYALYCTYNNIVVKLVFPKPLAIYFL